MSVSWSDELERGFCWEENTDELISMLGDKTAENEKLRAENQELRNRIADICKRVEALKFAAKAYEDKSEKLRAENQSLREALERVLCECNDDLSGRAKMFIEEVLRGEKMSDSRHSEEMRLKKERLVKAAPMLLEALEAVEWNSANADWHECPCCGESMADGHNTDCDLGNALKRAR